MSQVMAVAIFVVKLVILSLGTGIAYIAHRAYQQTRETSFRALSIGFGIATFGALLAGLAHRIFGVPLQAGVLIEGLLTAFGFAIIMYSLYLQR